MDNPFAQVPDDRESIVSLIKREVEEEWHDHQLPPLDLDRCTREAVDALWQSDVKTFVPLLALRRVRSCVRAGHCAITRW